jgi:hypothetical protein
MADSVNSTALPSRRASGLLVPKPKKRRRRLPSHLREFVAEPTHAERVALRTIVERADLITTEHGKWLLVPASAKLLDVLAAFEAGLADLEFDDDDRCAATDDAPMDIIVTRFGSERDDPRLDGDGDYDYASDWFLPPDPSEALFLRDSGEVTNIFIRSDGKGTDQCGCNGQWEPLPQTRHRIDESGDGAAALPRS